MMSAEDWNSRHPKLGARLSSRLTPTSRGCLVWTGCRGKMGYGQISVSRKARAVHKMAWVLAYGDLDDTEYLRHKCGVRACANVAHLEKVQYRRTFQRPASGNTRLTWEQVCQIRSRFNIDTADRPRKFLTEEEFANCRISLAAEFGVSCEYVGMILRGEARVDR